MTKVNTIDSIVRSSSNGTLAIHFVEHLRTGSIVFVFPTDVDVKRKTDGDRLDNVKDYDDCLN